MIRLIYWAFISLLLAGLAHATVTLTYTPAGASWQVVDIATGAILTRKPTQAECTAFITQKAELEGKTLKFRCISSLGSGVATYIKTPPVTTPENPGPFPEMPPTPTDPDWKTPDISAYVTPVPGQTIEMIGNTAERPSYSDDTGQFRTAGVQSHMAFDDPIVYPGQKGKSHGHQFFGNGDVDYASTRMIGCKKSTIRGGLVNCSGYWTPLLFYPKTGKVVKSRGGNFYYKCGYNRVQSNGQYKCDDIVPFPSELRMIAGNPTNTDINNMPGYWKCDDDAGAQNVKAFPKCKAGGTLTMNLFFPQCWDGKNLDSPDHKSHMAYPANGRCPATHPVVGPEISYHIYYTVPADQFVGAALSSDKKGNPVGASLHGDWWNGWKPDVMAEFVKNCDAVPGHDCHSHLLGGGRELKWEDKYGNF